MVLQAHASGRLVRVELALQARNLVAQTQAFLLESSHQQLVQRIFVAGAINHGIEIAVLDTQVDQPTLR